MMDIGKLGAVRRCATCEPAAGRLLQIKNERNDSNT